MALFKKVNLNNGVEVEYWKILGFENLNFITGKATVRIGGYVNKNLRNENVRGIVTVKNFEVELENFEGDIRDFVYEQLPTLKDKRVVLSKDGKEVEPFFKGATEI